MVKAQNQRIKSLWDNNVYVIEQTTLRDAFLASGVVQPMAELNATEGGDTVQVPFWKANLTGDFETLTDSTSLTPGKITADKQIGVIVHRGRAWEARDLAALAAGSDPMAAIGSKVADYVANQRQKDLIKTLEGTFGALTGGDSPAFSALRFDTTGMTALGPRQCAKARSLLGDQGDKLTAVAMHSAVYYDLVERRAIEYVTNTEARLSTPATGASTINAFGGSIVNAFTGEVTVPTFMGLRVIVSDDLAPTSTNYPVYFFTAGAIASGEQMGLRTETDRDILAKSNAMSIDLHYVYHPIGAKWGGVVNPTNAQLATVASWTRVYENKNIGIVRGTVTSNY
jgi:Major capsid protein 13-like